MNPMSARDLFAGLGSSWRASMGFLLLCGLTLLGGALPTGAQSSERFQLSVQAERIALHLAKENPVSAVRIQRTAPSHGDDDGEPPWSALHRLEPLLVLSSSQDTSPLPAFFFSPNRYRPHAPRAPPRL